MSGRTSGSAAAGGTAAAVRNAVSLKPVEVPQALQAGEKFIKWDEVCIFTLLIFVAGIHCDCVFTKGWCRTRYRDCTECTYEFLNNPKNISETVNTVMAFFHESNIPVVSKDLFEPSTKRKVITLSITYSKVQEIMSDAFGDFGELSELDLSHNSISKIEDRTFYSSPYLWIVDLYYNNITEIGDTVFNNKRDKLRLNLSQNHLKTFRAPARIATLDLSFNFISNIDVDFLRNATTLEKIDFSHNVIDSIDANAFSYLEDLSHLNLSYNYLKTYQSNFNTSARINNVDLSNNYIEKIEVSLPFRGFVSYLNLSHNSITKVNSSNIKLSTDTYVYLSHNNIKSLTADDLSYANKAKLLDLSNNRITEILAGTFRKQMQLIQLDLSNNEIEKLEFGSFYGLLQLEVLNLSNNKLKYIHELGFLNTPQISKLFIANNQLKFINVDDLIGNIYLNTVAIHGNEMVCQDVLKILEKFKSADISVPYGPEDSYVNGIKCENGTSMWEEPKDVLVEDVKELMGLIGKIQERKRNCNSTFLGVLVGLMSVLIVLFGFEAGQKFYHRRTG